MFELILLLCLIPIVAIVLGIAVIYYNLKRKLRGLRGVDGPEALDKMFRDLLEKSKTEDTKSKTQKNDTRKAKRKTDDNIEFEDAEFKEL